MNSMSPSCWSSGRKMKKITMTSRQMGMDTHPKSLALQVPWNPCSLTNQGKLLLDATCAPSDITYPTDIGLLNKSREKLEKIIDTLHKPLAGK
ncbi:hypothetical protein [Sporosarcina limicola]|uniref:Uncharacterized protein n=1 Tax=Sporosarcina limicola TaxID=34101 RepID=A0A927MSX4_9BACL|nr:hypothetical protein [Sporosarcina limicola]